MTVDRTVPARAAGALVFRLVRVGENFGPLLDLFEAAHRETRFGDIPFSRDKALTLLLQVLAEDTRHLLAVAEVNGRPEGVVFASVGEYFVGTDALIVTINVIYTSQTLRGSLLGGRAALGLFKAVGRWSTGIGAREILLHTTSGIRLERVGRAVGRMGFEVVGGTYVAVPSGSQYETGRHAK
ncbi:MAG: hypothetical protein HC794_00595 [Nitrospiraceae bacterium]|nr:hypothetical protein [Nitrospiraceae bacterium]